MQFYPMPVSSNMPSVANPMNRTHARVPSNPRATTTVAPEPTAITRTRVATEYASLRYPNHCPLGIYVTPSPDNMMEWHAVFFVHQGYYVNAILKFKIVFPVDYPNRPPTVQFTSDVFHPLIRQKDGIMSIKTRFRIWRPDQHKIFEVLHWVKSAFKMQVLQQLKEEDCYNKEAFKYHESISSFTGLAMQTSSLSQSSSALFDEDHPSMAGKGDFTLMFSKVNSDRLATLRSQVGLKEWEDVTQVTE